MSVRLGASRMADSEQTDQLMAGIVAISILGLSIGACITWLERTLPAWR